MTLSALQQLYLHSTVHAVQMFAGVFLEVMTAWNPGSVLGGHGVKSEAHLRSQSQCETV